MFLLASFKRILCYLANFIFIYIYGYLGGYFLPTVLNAPNKYNAASTAARLQIIYVLFAIAIVHLSLDGHLSKQQQ